MEREDVLRARASEVLRAASAERRAAERARDQSKGDLTRVLRATVEGLEALTDAIEGVQADLPAGVRDVLRLSARAAWERLQGAGVALDGAVGEPLDLARHRVTRTVAGSGRPGTVAALIAPGVTFEGTRIREAVVGVVGEGKGDGTGRD